MEYRKLPKSDEKISVFGLGSSSLGPAGAKETEATITMALENGINYFDMAAGDASPFAAYGRAVAGAREKVFFQVHFGADYRSGKYGWTLELDEIKRSVDWQLKMLQTDYIDFGFIHCIDEEEDLQAVLDGGILDYIKELQKSGAVHRIGMSSHTPEIVEKMLDTGLLDMVMFSINPAYDYSRGDYGIGATARRRALYRRCSAEGVGISVMKAFAGGQLLDAKTSPFGKALSEYQCLQYALDTPGVLTVLPGVRNREDLKRILGFFDAPAADKDYSVLAEFEPAKADGVCVYCNHCAPCPAGLDIGLINKYFDLANAGDTLAKDHYLHLTKQAGDCIGCGHCDRRCPFHVHQSARMQEIRTYFGR